MAKGLPNKIFLKQGTKGKKPYHLYDIFTIKKEAMMVANMYKIKDKSKYYILPAEVGWLYPRKVYGLYFNNIKTRIFT